MKGKNRTGVKVMRIAITVLTSGFILFLAFKDLSLLDIAASFREVSLFWIGLTFISVLVNILAKIQRWRVLMGKSVVVPGTRLGMALLTGQMFNSVIPGRVGDLPRALAVGDRNISRTYALSTVALEKFFDLAAYALLIVLLLVSIPLPDWIGTPLVPVLFIITGIAVGIVLVYRFNKELIRIIKWGLTLFPDIIGRLVLPRLQFVFDSLSIIGSRRRLFLAATWTGIAWGTALMNNILMFYAFNFSLPLTAALLLLVALQAGISSGIVPGSIGIFEYICVLSLAVFSVEQSMAVSYGMALHAIVLLPPLLGGALSFWFLSMQGVRLK